MFKKYSGLFVVIITLVITTSCGTVHRASSQDDTHAKAYETQKGMSNIYLYRNQIDNFDILITAEIDGKHVSDTEQRTFLVKTVIPGQHVITAHAENTSKIEITTAADKNYFIWLEVTLGLEKPRAKLHAVSEQRGKAGIKDSTLVN
ncbi:MAG: hypothetical protein ACC653_11730 [Gammaproteobacteria bacterium]